MKTVQEIQAELGILSTSEQLQLRDLSKLLTEFAEKKHVTFEGYGTLRNMVSELLVFKEGYNTKLFGLLKQGHRVED